MEKTAKATWHGDGLDFTLAGGSGYAIEASNKPGEHAGSPMEMQLQALVGCTSMDVVSILQKKRQDVSGFEAEIKGVRADDHPTRYTEIEIVYVVRGRDIDPAAVERAIELSRDKYCSVMATFHLAEVPVRTSFRIEEVAAA